MSALTSIETAINENYKSQAYFARLINVNKTTLSRVLKGTYPGNADSVTDKILARLSSDNISLRIIKDVEQSDWPTLDLYSGIGGFSLGIERSGFNTVAFCEKEKVCRDWLNYFWPEAPIFEDIRELNYDKLKAAGINNIKAIVGGFPCQDISSNGKGEGLSGERSGLWSEYRRLIAEIRPDYAIIENVERLRSNGLTTVMQDLWSVGYDAEWHIISAANFGYLHQRERIWIIAYPSTFRFPKGLLEGYSIPCKPQTPIAECGDNWISEWVEVWRRAGLLRPVDGISSNMVRWAVKSFGNSVVPEIPQWIAACIKDYEQQRRGEQ